MVKESTKKSIHLEVVSILLLILAGIGAIIHIHKGLISGFLEAYDEQQLELAQSIDRNINSHLERCRKSLAYVTNRRGFLEAESTWRESGETEDLLFRMGENLLTQDELITVMLAEQNGEIFLSTDESLGYTRLEGVGNEEAVYYTGPQGSLYLGFVEDAGEGLRYVGLMKLKDLYRAAVIADLGEGDHVLLTDTAGKLLVSSHGTEIELGFMEDFLADPERLDAAFLQTCQNQQSLSMTSFEHNYAAEGQQFDARMVVIPTSQSENRALAIGLFGNFDILMDPLNKATGQIFCCILAVALGIVLLVRLVFHVRRRSERELQILRKKNEAMEELNRQTQEMAHHQRLELIGTLTAGVAHEFNNLLTPIMGYSILALENIPEENEKAAAQLLQIYESSRKAKEITSRLSELSRKNSGESMSLLRSDALIKKILNVARPACPQRVEVEFQHNAGAAQIRGNETQLTQLFLNLILNAFHAMTPAGGTLTVETAVVEQQVVFTVTDSGCGILPEVLPHIFDPFYTTKENGKGTGLGLAIVQQVLSEHHGQIEVETEPGKGSSFIVSLPRAEETAALNDAED